jgi:hypothetical protein
MDTDTFAHRLIEGERIVWSGQPKRGLLFTGQDFFVVPFSFLFCAIFIFGTPAEGPGATLLTRSLVILIGLYFAVGRFLHDAWVRSGTCYAVTNKRILILRSAPFAKFTALDLNQLPAVRLTERWDGRGTIRFGPPLWLAGRASATLPSLDRIPQFLAIEDAQRVFDLIHRTGKQRASW